MKMHRISGHDEIYIAEMTDEHLKNTVSLHIENIKKCVAVLESEKSDTLNSVLYKKTAISKDKAKKIITWTYEILPHYVMEACIRGIVFIELRSCFGRSSQIIPNNNLLISPGVGDYEQIKDKDDEFYIPF